MIIKILKNDDIIEIKHCKMDCKNTNKNVNMGAESHTETLQVGPRPIIACQSFMTY